MATHFLFFFLLSRVLATLAERKSAFLKWAEELREQEEERERKKLRQLKINFVSMLKECKELTSRTRYAKVQHDARFQATATLTLTCT